ncbi:MAG: helix-turn-helix domain-containing protein [Kofleriaceae bacterium]
MSKRTAAALAAFGWPPILTTATAAAYTSTSKWTLYRAVAAGTLAPAGRRGRAMTFTRESLDRWMVGSGTETETVLDHPKLVRSSSGSAAAIVRLRAIAKCGGAR